MERVVQAGRTDASQAVSFVSLAGCLSFNRYLIRQMVKRAIVGRYKGSILGLAWSLFTPVMLLSVYTFVFSVVFKARWGELGGEDNKAQFAVVLFVGLIIHGLFAEVLNKAPSLIASNVNYVKKVVFPLEILPIIDMGAALFHCFVSLLVLLVACLFINGGLQWTVVLFPLVLLPLVVFTMGLAWLLASLGVFLRDIGQIIGLLMMMMLFLAPVFYPISVLPAAYRPWIMANPLTFIIEQSRAVLIYGQLPSWQGIFIYSVVAVFVAWAGYAWFQKTKSDFADAV